MKPNILVVEDELLIARGIKSILSEEGYNVIINIVSVEQAIVAIEEHKPDLILIDINLKKDKDGVDLGHYLLEKDAVPYIYITSFSDKLTLDRVKDTRPYGYIVKPFKPIDVKTTIAIVLNNYKHRRIDIVRNDDEIHDDIPFVVKQTIDYIHQNINEKIEVSELIKMSRWKSQHFLRLFTKYTGTTPYQYILDRKIEKAKALLAETTLSASQISFELGFQSRANFYNAFKKKTDTTPENFRIIQNVNKFT